MKFVVRPQHMVSLGGYIVEVNVPYRNIIVVNPTDEPIKVDIPIFSTEWVDEHRKLGLDITTTKDEDSFLRTWRKEKAKLDKIKVQS